MPRPARALPLLLLLATPIGAQEAPPDGRILYNAKCANCHGRKGKARPDLAKEHTPDLNSPAWQKEATDDEIHDVIAKGVGETKMKAFAPELMPAEIDAIVKYVRSLALAAAPAK
jgi:mono/diheme cytochrome c family protein